MGEEKGEPLQKSKKTSGLCIYDFHFPTPALSAPTTPEAFSPFSPVACRPHTTRINNNNKCLCLLGPLYSLSANQSMSAVSFVSRNACRRAQPYCDSEQLCSKLTRNISQSNAQTQLLSFTESSSKQRERCVAKKAPSYRRIVTGQTEMPARTLGEQTSQRRPCVQTETDIWQPTPLVRTLSAT